MSVQFCSFVIKSLIFCCLSLLCRILSPTWGKLAPRKVFVHEFLKAASPLFIYITFWLKICFCKDKAVSQATEVVEKSSVWFKVKNLLKSFQPAYWQALAVIIVLYFARFDASFLLLRAKQVYTPTIPFKGFMELVLQYVQCYFL